MYVCMYAYFEVAMVDVELVECLESLDDLDEDPPDVVFGEEFCLLLLFDDLLVEVSIVGVVHHDAETVGGRVDEGLLVPDNVGVLDRGQDAHLVECVVLLLLAQVLQLHLLQRILLPIMDSFDLING